jgi:hypothetical protein
MKAQLLSLVFILNGSGNTGVEKSWSFSRVVHYEGTVTGV